MHENLLICITTEPVKVRHVCWYTQIDIFNSNKINLYEVVEEWHPHPQAPKEATIPIYQTYFIKSVFRSNPTGAALSLLEAANENILNIAQPSKSREYAVPAEAST